MNVFMKTEDDTNRIRDLQEEISRLKEQIRALQVADEKRKIAEEAIRASGEMLRLVLDNIPQRVFWKDIHSVYLGCNMNFARAAGVGPPENIAGKTDYDLAWTRAEADAFRRDDREVMDNDRPKYHIIEPQMQADGRQSWLDTNKVPLHDAQGHVIGILGTYDDITERLAMEERLKLTQFAVDHFTDSSIWLNSEGKILYVNEAACRSLGYTGEELLSMYIWDIDPDYIPDKYALVWNRIKEQGSLIFESVHVKNDGKRFPVEVSTNYLRFHNREYMISFDRDISGRKQVEAQLEEAKSHAEVYVDLMSHDIGNMNQAMMGYLEMALDTLKPGEYERFLLTQPLEIIRNSSRLIGNVKKLKQLQAGDIPPETLDLGQVLYSVKADYSGIPGREITINYVPVQGYMVEANAMLKDLFANLIDNAIRHSQGKLIVDIDVHKTTMGGQTYYQVDVADNGPGISDQLKEKLLSAVSYRAPKAERRGIGLLLIKTLLDRFHGSLRIENRVPEDYRKGARFVVLLPARVP
jgi:PAS domain S-box-containing protein